MTMEKNSKKRIDVEEVENNVKKVMTKYDKKVQERKLAEAKELRSKKVFKISCIIVLIAVIMGVASYFVIKYNKANGEYITVGDNKITGIEYDYYYNNTADNFISSYSAYLSYFGLDTTKSYADQSYSADLTWEDYFAQGAVDSIKQTIAMVADAKSNNFQYDVTSDYDAFVNSISEAASSNSVSVKQYYKTAFGSNATESNLKSIIKEYLTASAYYSQLAENNAPSESDISTYYQSNKDQYDSINYRVLSVATEEEGNEMLSKVTDEASFETLCKTYASDDEKTKYESEDASLVEGGTSSSISTAYSAWLYDASRKDGDITVLEDADNSVYCVVYFVSRYYDATTNDKTIADTLTGNAVSTYIQTLTANYTVTDKNNHLKYLSVPTESETASN